MINIGKKSSVKEELNEYTKVNKDEIVEHDIYIEKVIVGETEENGCFAAVAGMDLNNNNNKVWFYAPTYDDACLCQATQEEIESICNKNYLYIIEEHEGKNGRRYFTGYITEGR